MDVRELAVPRAWRITPRRLSDRHRSFFELQRRSQVDINALDPEPGIPWGLSGKPLMSDKDASAMSLAEAAAAGLLPTYEECLAVDADLRTAV